LLWIAAGAGIALLACVGIVAGGWLAVRQRFADTPDTHDLDARLAAQAEDYLASRPHSALVIGVVQDGRSAIFGFGALPDGSTPPLASQQAAPEDPGRGLHVLIVDDNEDSVESMATPSTRSARSPKFSLPSRLQPWWRVVR
jgi:hypothetical protein